MTRPRKPQDFTRVPDFVRVWILARVNGADYRGESLPAQPIQFPTGTWLQRKLQTRTDDARRLLER